jgi:hypothetical protein
VTARHKSGGLAGVTSNVMPCTNVCVLKNKNSIHNFCDKLLERKFWGIEGDESLLRWSTRRYFGSLLCSGVGYGFGSVLALT